MNALVVVFSSFLLLWLPASRDCSSITLVVPPKSQDCLHMEKEKGDQIASDVQVVSGQKINIRLIGPDRSQLDYFKDIIQIEIDHHVEESGEYTFCFLNSNSYRDEAVVQFEYDLHDEDMDNDSRLKKQIKQEKKKFIKDQLRKMKPKLANIGQALTADGGVHPSLAGDNEELDGFGNDTVKEVEESILILSLQLDRMEHYLKRHTARMTYQYHVQQDNRSMVAFFSAFLCIIIVTVGCIQVVFLKGFINGKRSWRFWQF